MNVVTSTVFLKSLNRWKYCKGPLEWDKVDLPFDIDPEVTRIIGRQSKWSKKYGMFLFQCKGMQVRLIIGVLVNFQLIHPTRNDPL